MNSEQQLFLLLGNWSDLNEIMNKGLSQKKDSEFISLVVNKIITQLKILKKMNRESSKAFLKETLFASIVNNFLIKFPKIENNKSNELLRQIISFVKHPESKIFTHKLIEILYRNNVDKKNDLLVFDFVLDLLEESIEWAMSHDVRQIIQTLKDRNELFGDELYETMITHKNHDNTNY